MNQLLHHGTADWQASQPFVDWQVFSSSTPCCPTRSSSSSVYSPFSERVGLAVGFREGWTYSPFPERVGEVERVNN